MSGDYCTIRRIIAGKSVGDAERDLGELAPEITDRHDPERYRQIRHSAFTALFLPPQLFEEPREISEGQRPGLLPQNRQSRKKLIDCEDSELIH